MKQVVTLFALALGCALAHAADPAPKKPTRMATCQKEATASGKKGEERKAVLQACLAAGKAAAKGEKKAG